MQYEFRTFRKILAKQYSNQCIGLCAALLVTVALTGCATTGGVSPDPGTTTAYVYGGDEELLSAHAPVFVIEHDEKSYNKIGTPSARFTKRDKEQVFVDPSTPTIYQQVRKFETDKGEYTNLIYRVHFERSPFTWAPFNASAGENVGAIAVVTLNEDKQPILLTTVQSCGCYHAITPTNFLGTDAYPEDYQMGEIKIYGEDLPGRLDFPMPYSSDSKIVITIRDGTHRIGGVQVSRIDALSNTSNTVRARTLPIEALRNLALGDATTSFYHAKGRKKGLVKGAHKPLETLLFGVWSWDANVGQDREYTSTEDGSRRFYTTLTASKKKLSDMWDYEGYLNHNGWKP